jgi:hypothetical protein
MGCKWTRCGLGASTGCKGDEVEEQLLAYERSRSDMRTVSQNSARVVRERHVSSIKTRANMHLHPSSFYMMGIHAVLEPVEREGEVLA